MRPLGPRPTIPEMMRAFVLLLVLCFAPLAGAEPLLLDRVVAVFTTGSDGKREVITLSDLEREARLALVSRGAVEAADAELPQDLLASALDWLLSELLIFEEAEQLAVAGVEAAEIEREIEAFETRFSSPEALHAFLQRHEIGRADLARVARRRLVVGRYLESRIRLAGAVTEGEVRSAYEQRRGELGGRAWDDAKHLLRAQLEKERREEVVAGLVQALRSRAGVRILHRLDG